LAEHDALPLAVSDRQWARVAQLLGRLDEAAPPAAVSRAILGALLYHAATGRPWTALPAGYPPPDLVRQTYERWRQCGLLTLLSAVLLVDLDAETEAASLTFIRTLPAPPAHPDRPS
jgi:transposase